MYGDKFNNLETLKLISRPVLLIHGTMDEIVPFEHSIELYSVLRNKYPPFWIEGYEHNNIL
jgi:dipeptidyl aminopeptidase/acylaminoacyl peptidase